VRTVAVVSYCRTGIAKANRGALNSTHGIPLTAHVLNHAVTRAGIEAAEIEDVVIGCGLPEGAAGQLRGSDVDLWELHEAYAVTTLFNQARLETPWEITNVNGGAVALGHPYGMSGVRYLGSTRLELRRRKKKRAVVGVCTAGGMSTAAFLEAP
jgi:acetyl-CoA acetyltransferase